MGKIIKLSNVMRFYDSQFNCFARELIELTEKGEEITIDGTHDYSPLLTENILLEYFDEFKIDPWGSYRKYFKSHNNAYPIIAVYDLFINRDINKQIYIRNDLFVDALLKGKLPEQLNMMTYDSLEPYIIEKKQRPISRKNLSNNKGKYR